MIDRKIRLYLFLKEIGGLDKDKFESDFEKRLIFQKRIYLLRFFGIDLGFRNNWYVHGPYCPSLTETGYELYDNLKEIKKESDSYKISDKGQEKLSRYKEFEGRIPDAEKAKYLELIASIHFLKNIGFLQGGNSKKNIKKELNSRGKRFTDSMFEKSWNLLKEYNLIKNGSK